MHRYDTPGPLEVRVDNRLGDVRLRTHAEAVTEVELSATGQRGDEALAATTVDHDEHGGRHRVIVETPHRDGFLRSLLEGRTQLSVTVRLPEGAEVHLATASGSVTAEGRYGSAGVSTASGNARLDAVDGDLTVQTASGDVAVGSVGGVTDVKTASGDVSCGRLGGTCAIKTASGDVDVDAAAGRLSVHSASGDLHAGDLADGCEVKTASGDQRIDRLGAGRARLNSVSGDVLVGVVAGRTVAVDAQSLTGRLSSDIDLDASGSGRADAEVEVTARTVSGDLRLVRSSPA